MSRDAQNVCASTIVGTVLKYFFRHFQTTNLTVSRPNGIACLRKGKLLRRFVIQGRENVSNELQSEVSRIDD